MYTPAARASSHAPVARTSGTGYTSRSSYGNSYGTTSSSYGGGGATSSSLYGASSSTVQPSMAGNLGPSRTRAAMLPDDSAPGAHSSALRRAQHPSSIGHSQTAPRASRTHTPAAAARQHTFSTTSYTETRQSDRSTTLPRASTDYPAHGSGVYDTTPARRPSLTGSSSATSSMGGVFDRHRSTTSARDEPASSAAASMMPPPRAGSSASLRAPSTSSNRDPPVGFRNMGNTCYMASALQCILHSSGSFVAELAQERIRHQPETSRSRLSTRSSNPDAVATALANLASANGATSALMSVKSGVSRMNSEFVGARQNDSHEFIRELLHGVHKEINRIESKPKYVEMKDIEGETDADAARRWISYSKTHDDSLVYDHFGGFIRNVTKCGACATRSMTFDPFLDLSVGVNSHLFSALAKTNEFETVNVFKCESCKKKGVASLRQTVIVEWPRTLVIHLKRFSQTGRKDNGAVRFPMHFTRQDAAPANIVMPRNVVFPAQGYTLSGVSMHHGSAGFGHYTAYVRNGSTWYQCDDERVTRTTESTVLSATTDAYVLFYSSED